jgi:thiol-disulfide isomerase/thioredoxin
MCHALVLMHLKIIIFYTGLTSYFSSFAPWCPACQHVATTWSAFALKGKQLGINVAEVDVTTQSGKSCYL